MKAYLSVIVIALFVLAACGPRAPDMRPVPSEPVTQPTVTQPTVDDTAAAQPSDVVGEVTADLTELDQSLDEELSLEEFDSLDADLAELEGLDY